MSRLYVREISGRYTTLRWCCVWVTQLIYFGLPWATWNGRQAMLFDLPARKFYVFGSVFWPQDLIYLVGFYLACFLLLLLVTAIAGRLWCGFACPHSVYTELFMWVERRIEGGRVRRMRLDEAPISLAKFGKKFCKHALWIALTLWIGITLVGYFTPIKVLLREFRNGVPGPWESFFITSYGAFAYVNAGWMREEVCRSLCPYAQFQSAMLDSHSLVVSYDRSRGEPRGLRRKKRIASHFRKLGDCIDCTICVQVCPTGIDIRDGFQQPCIECAACIDACDAVMDKIGSPRGLVRFARLVE